MVAHSLRAEYDGSEDGTGRGTPLVPSVCGTLSDGAHMGGGLNGQDAYTGRIIPVGFVQNQRDEVRAVAGALAAEPGMKQQSYIAFHNRQDHDVSGDVTHPIGRQDNGLGLGMKVRRLTPLECERLQGFPDGWTEVPYRGKPAADGPRYKALGNSMAVNCMFWIGDRIQQSVERNGG